MAKKTVKKTTKKSTKTKTAKKSKYKFKFDVDRYRWSEGGLVNRKEHPDGGDTMCVLGFMGEALGIPKHALKHAGGPSTTARKYWKKWGELGLMECVHGSAVSSSIANQIMSVNDRGVANAGTESKLKKLFDRLDIKVNFINKFPKEIE